MKTILIFCFVLNTAWAIQKDSFYRQRAIMLSQHEYEKSLDLMLLDPETCRVPIQRRDRIKVLKLNIKSLEEKGKLTHCPQLMFSGSRKILQNLEKQKVVLEDTEKKLTDDTGIITKDNEPESDPIVDSEVLEPVVNSRPLPPGKKERFGSLPSSLPILSGYVGVPYASTPEYDETFHYFNQSQGVTGSSYYVSEELPSGLTVLTGGGGELVRSGEIVGIPAVAGSFSPFMEVGWVGLYGVRNPVYKGPVKINIYPTPKYTIFHPLQRSRTAPYASFSNEAPFLKVLFTGSTNRRPNNSGSGFSGFVRTLNGIKSGKHYFEIKILDPGKIGIGFATKLDQERLMYITDASHFIGAAGNEYLHPTGSTNKTVARSLKRDDIVMIAIDADMNKIWTGVNGIWRDQSKFGFRDPGGGAEGLDVTRLTRGEKINEFWPEIHGQHGTSFIANFGDQPWDFPPPSGFGGIPLEVPELSNLWNSNTATMYMGVGTDMDVWEMGNSATSHQAYVIGDKGDAILSMSPKSRGRWQFEISSKGYGEKTQVGLAPVDFDTKSYKKLGAAGTGSIGLRRLDEQVSKTGKGLIEVDGKPHYIDNYDDETRFTFDCNFDADTVTILANGKEILRTRLPENRSGQWVVGATSASGKATLYSTLERMKYPVRGVKAWSLESRPCRSCKQGSPSSGSAVNVVTCAETNFLESGKVASTENMSLACTLPATKVDRRASCWKRIPTSCMKSGEKFYCTAMDDFTGSSSQAECSKSCSRVMSVYKTCTQDGWKTETIHGF